MENRLCDDNGANGVAAIKNCIQTSSSTTMVMCEKNIKLWKNCHKELVHYSALLLYSAAFLLFLRFVVFERRVVKLNLLLVVHVTHASQANFWLIFSPLIWRMRIREWKIGGKRTWKVIVCKVFKRFKLNLDFSSSSLFFYLLCIVFPFQHAIHTIHPMKRNKMLTIHVKIARKNNFRGK